VSELVVVLKIAKDFCGMPKISEMTKLISAFLFKTLMLMK
jgi:hypothetical protein